MKSLIIYIILIFVLQLSAVDITNWSELSLNLFNAESDRNIEIITSASPEAEKIDSKPKMGLRYRHDLTAKISDKLSISLLEDLYFSEKSYEQKSSFLYGDTKLKMLYHTKNQFLKLQFSSSNYANDHTLFLINPSLEREIQKQYILNSTLDYRTKWRKFDLNILADFRNMNYITLKEETEDSLWDNDAFSYLDMGYKVTNQFRIFGTGYYKNALNEISTFDHLQFGGGFEYDKRFDLFSSVFAKFTYLNNNSERIDDEKDHYLYTKVRYTRRFFNGIAGFVSLINRSCFDYEQGKLLRISNVLKIHFKYSYLTENIRDSFIITGIKLNPENKGSLVFSQINQHLIREMYFSADAKYARSLFTQFSGKLEYHITPIKSLWLKSEFTNYHKRHSQNIISLGATVIF